MPASRADIAPYGADANVDDRHFLYRCIDFGVPRLELGNIMTR